MESEVKFIYRVDIGHSIRVEKYEIVKETKKMFKVKSVHDLSESEKLFVKNGYKSQLFKGELVYFTLKDALVKALKFIVRSQTYLNCELLKIDKQIKKIEGFIDG